MGSVLLIVTYVKPLEGQNTGNDADAVNRLHPGESLVSFSHQPSKQTGKRSIKKSQQWSHPITSLVVLIECPKDWSTQMLKPTNLAEREEITLPSKYKWGIGVLEPMTFSVWIDGDDEKKDFKQDLKDKGKSQKEVDELFSQATKDRTCQGLLDLNGCGLDETNSRTAQMTSAGVSAQAWIRGNFTTEEWIEVCHKSRAYTITDPKTNKPKQMPAEKYVISLRKVLDKTRRGDPETKAKKDMDKLSPEQLAAVIAYGETLQQK